MRIQRRDLLRSVGAAGVVGLAGCPGGDGDGDGSGDGTSTPTEPLPDDGDYALQRVADGFVSPTQLAVNPDDGTRYVLDQVGTVTEIGPDGGTAGTFLDLTSRVVVSPERGLLGMVFHPEWPDDPRIFLRYSVPETSGIPEGYSHTEILSEMEVSPDGTPQLDTEQRLIEFPSPTIYHQAGTIAFGPDGYLYVAMGEGTERQFAQDVETNLLGGIHRIDVDSTSGDRPYGIPSDNPLVGRAGRDEYYAWGLRNPWRMAFSDGDLIAGDVGEYRMEEVDVIRKGGNYGWPYREGTTCTGWNDTGGDGDRCGVDPQTIPGDEFTDPVIAFPNTRGRDSDVEVGGTAVIAGHVYDRDDVSALADRYLFANYTRSLDALEGDLYAADPTGDGQWPASRLTVSNAPGGGTHRVVNSLGRDSEGALYLLAVAVPDTQNRFEHRAGDLLKVVPPGEADTLPVP